MGSRNPLRNGGSNPPALPSPLPQQPCLHTERPEFINNHIQRCTACQLKYARKAEEAANRTPYRPKFPSRPNSVEGSHAPGPAAASAAGTPISTMAPSGLRPARKGTAASTTSTNGSNPRPDSPSLSDSGRRSVSRLSIVSSASHRLGSRAPTAKPRQNSLNNATAASPALAPSALAEDDTPQSTPSSQASEFDIFPSPMLPNAQRSMSENAADRGSSGGDAPSDKPAELQTLARSRSQYDARDNLGPGMPIAAERNGQRMHHQTFSRKMSGPEVPPRILLQKLPYASPARGETKDFGNDIPGLLEFDPLQDSIQQALLNQIDSLQGQLRNRESEIQQLRKVVATRMSSSASPGFNHSGSDDAGGSSHGDGNSTNNAAIPLLQPSSQQHEAKAILDAVEKFDSFRKSFEDSAPYFRNVACGPAGNSLLDVAASPLPPLPLSSSTSRVLSTPTRRTRIVPKTASNADGAGALSGDECGTPVTLSHGPGLGAPLPLMTPRRHMTTLLGRSIAASNADSSDHHAWDGMFGSLSLDYDDSDDSDSDGNIGDDGPNPCSHRKKQQQQQHEPFRISRKLQWAVSCGEFLLNQARQLQLQLSEREQREEQLSKQLEDVTRRQDVEMRMLRRKTEQQQKLNNDDLYSLHQENERLSQQLDDKKASLSKVTMEATRLQKQLESAQSQIDQMQSREAELVCEIDKIKVRHEADTAGLRRSISQFQREKSDVQEKLEVLRDSLSGKLRRMGLKGDSIISSCLADPGSSATLLDNALVNCDVATANGGLGASGLSLEAHSASSTTGLSVEELQRQIRRLEQANGQLKRQASRARATLKREMAEKRELQSMLAACQEQIEHLQQQRNSLALADDLLIEGTSRSRRSISNASSVGSSPAASSPLVSSIARLLLRRQVNTGAATLQTPRNILAQGSPVSAGTSYSGGNNGVAKSRLRTVSFGTPLASPRSLSNHSSPASAKRVSMPPLLSQKLTDELGIDSNLDEGKDFDDWVTEGSELDDNAELEDVRTDADEVDIEDEDIETIKRYQRRVQQRRKMYLTPHLQRSAAGRSRRRGSIDVEDSRASSAAIPWTVTAVSRKRASISSVGSLNASASNHPSPMSLNYPPSPLPASLFSDIQPGVPASFEHNSSNTTRGGGMLASEPVFCNPSSGSPTLDMLSRARKSSVASVGNSVRDYGRVEKRPNSRDGARHRRRSSVRSRQQQLGAGLKSLAFELGGGDSSSHSLMPTAPSSKGEARYRNGSNASISRYGDSDAQGSDCCVRCGRPSSGKTELVDVSVSTDRDGLYNFPVADCQVQTETYRPQVADISIGTDYLQLPSKCVEAGVQASVCNTDLSVATDVLATLSAGAQVVPCTREFGCATESIIAGEAMIEAFTNTVEHGVNTEGGDDHHREIVPICGALLSASSITRSNRLDLAEAKVGCQQPASGNTSNVIPVHPSTNDSNVETDCRGLVYHAALALPRTCDKSVASAAIATMRSFGVATDLMRVEDLCIDATIANGNKSVATIELDQDNAGVDAGMLVRPVTYESAVMTSQAITPVRGEEEVAISACAPIQAIVPNDPRSEDDDEEVVFANGSLEFVDASMGTIATNVYSENFTRSIVKLEAVDEQESVESFDAESSVYDSANSSIYYSQSLVNIDNIVSHYEHYSEDEASSASIQDILWLDDGNEDCKHDSESDSGPATPTDDRASVAAPQLPSQLDVKKPATLCDQAIQTEPFTVYPPGFVEDQRQQQTEQLSLANLRSMILNLPPTFSPTDPKPVDLVCRRCRGIRLVAVPYDQSRDDSGSHRSNASSLGDSRPLNLEDSCLGRRPSVRIKVVSAKPGEGDGNLSPLLVGASRGGQPLVNGRPGSTIIPIRSSMSLSPASANSMLARLASPSSSGGGRLSPGTAPGTVGRYGSLGSVNPRAARGRRTSSNATAIPLSGLFSDKGLRATCSETPVPTPMVASVKDSDQPHHQQQPQKSQKAHLNEIESTHTKSPALECSEPHSKPQRKDCNEESAARYEPPERGNKYSPPHPVDLDARANMAPPTTLGEERRDTRFSYTASPSLGRSGSSRKFLPRTPPPPPPVYSPSKQQASKYRQPDPLVVQAIARTMVGSFMWKYTSSSMLSGNITGGSSRPGNHRERRHLRYFWIHPYAKMLNWNRYPPSGNVSLSMRMRSQGTRSAFIRSVRIVPDLQAGRSNDDASPRHCIIITTNKKEVKIKATSPQDHEQWVMAMNYLQAQPVFTSNAYAAPLAIVAEPERPEPRTVLATEGERDLGSKHVDYNTFSQPQAPLQLDSNRGRHTHTHSYQRPPPLPRQSHGPSTTHIFSGHPVSMAAVNIYRRPATSHQRTISNDEFKVGRGASLPRPSTAVASTTPKRSAVSSLFKASGGILRRKLMTQYDQAPIHSPPSATKLPTRAGSNTDIDDSRRCGHTAVSPAGKPSPAFFGDSGNKPPISFMSSPRQRPTSSPATPEGYVRVSHGVRWSPNARSPDPSTTTPTQRMRKRLGISMMRMFGAKFDEQLPASPPLTSLGLRNVGSQFEPMITTTMPQNSTNMHV